jgi:hypothetical protein
MTLACRLLEQAQAWPELLAPLLKRFASDSVASVQAAVLRQLPFLQYKNPGLGWELLERCLDDPHPGLWAIARSSLYYQRAEAFDRVQVYLRQMQTEIPGQAAETWAYLSAWASLDGQLSEEEFFESLEVLNQPELWKTVASVFAVNQRHSHLSSMCQRGLVRILRRAEVTGDLLELLDRELMESLGYADAEIDLVQRFVDKIRPEFQINHFLHLMGWLARFSQHDPIGALSLLECFAEKLENFNYRSDMFHVDPLIMALVEILREADESDDTDLIGRCIALQDRFLVLDLTGMEKMLDRAVER